MPTATYRLHLDETTSFVVDLETTQPIYQLVDSLAACYSRSNPGELALFSGAGHRRLSREQTLVQAGCASGSHLYLANFAAPWWEPASEAENTGPLIRVGIWTVLRQLAPLGAIGGCVLILTIVGFVVLSNSREAWERSGDQLIAALGEPPKALAPTVTLVAERPRLNVALPPPSSPTPLEATATVTVTSVPGSPQVQARGIRSEYLNRGERLFFQSRRAVGAWLWSDSRMQSRVPATRGYVAVINGDSLNILDASVPGVYQVRVVSNALDPDDPLVRGAIGWIARWLVEDSNVPPPLPSTTRVFRAEVVASFPGSGQSGTRRSCVVGRVVDRGGNGVGDAVIDGNNGVSNTSQVITDNQGNYSICGLGDSNWSIVLRYIPGKASLRSQIVATIYVNGDRSQVAVVNFIER